MFIINEDNNKYVAASGAGDTHRRSGLPSSFTGRLKNAQKFSTREEAKRHACGNERVAAISEELL